VVIRRLLDDVEFSWGEAPLAGAPGGFRFLHGSGTARVPPRIVAGTLFEVLRQAVEALTEEQPQSERLRALRGRIAALADAERQFARTALLAGLGATPEHWLERWQKLLRDLEPHCSGCVDSIQQWFEPQAGDHLCVAGSCEAAVMFGSASPTLTEHDVLTIATLLVRSNQPKPSSKWTALAGEPQALSTGESPWSDGYRLAQEWSAKAGIRHTHNGVVDVEAHLEKLGVTVANIELDDPQTAGLAVQPRQGAPHIFVNRRNPRCEYPSGRRFILAHELCHLLHDRAHGRSLAMISGPWAPKDLEKRANAFAAALLMPSALLKKGLPAGDDLDYQSLLVLAKRLHVSTDALAHHLANCGLISEPTRDVLLDQLVNRPTVGNPTRWASRRQSKN
jgi:Zn-dependent peptidase ImmA (M78 family)